MLNIDYRLAVCGCGNRLVVYSLRTGKLLRRLEEHEAGIVDYYFRMKNSLQVIIDYQISTKFLVVLQS